MPIPQPESVTATHSLTTRVHQLNLQEHHPSTSPKSSPSSSSFSSSSSLSTNMHLPTPQEQKEIVTRLHDHPFRLNDSWFLISKGWWDRWTFYVSSAEVEQQPPSEIDNKPLLSPASLKEPPPRLLNDLIEDADFVLEPEPVYQKLHEWYGGGPPLPRKVVKALDGRLFLEIYPLRLKVSYEKLATLSTESETKEKEMEVSRTMTVKDLAILLATTFNIEDSQSLTLLNGFDNPPVELVSSTNNDDDSLEELGIVHGQAIIMKHKLPNSSNAFATSSSSFSPSLSVTHSVFNKKTTTSSPTGSIFSASTLPSLSASSGYGSGAHKYPTFNSNSSSASPSPSSSSSSSFRPTPTRGLCGLVNLGNTCFMNSALQCLSNTPKLSNYFLSGEYIGDINHQNPLGMEGKLASNFGALVKELWSGEISSVAPRAFKVIIAKFASQFAGYGQHDAQELLAFLLDGLHEDLNRVKKKPYVEMKESEHERPDELVADEAWGNHRLRNDSVIVDQFQGQFKSRLICPNCAKMSITFDPFMYLSLPLSGRSIRVKVVHHDRPLPWLYQLLAPPKGKIADLRHGIAQLAGLQPNSLIFAEVFKNRLQRYYSDDESLREVSSNVSLYAFEIVERPSRVYLETIILPVMQRIPRSTSKSEYASKAMRPVPAFVGDPFFISVSRALTSYRELYRVVWRHMQRVIKSEYLNGKGAYGMDSPSEEEEGAMGEGFYTFKILNERTKKERDVTDIDDVPIAFGEGEALVLEWDLRAWNSVYDKEQADKYKIHDSCKKKAQDLTLVDCLEQFLTQERLSPDDQWYCPRCADFKQATKKFDLWKLPEVLVVHLKRFSNKLLFRDKLDTLVDFPISGLDLSEFTLCPQSTPPLYDLYAVCNHYGSLGGGHYTAFAKNTEKNGWYLFDDSSVTSVSDERKVKTKAAYVLFYRRRLPTIPKP